jgi:starvation-inducible outer membrane lipoprotein
MNKTCQFLFCLFLISLTACESNFKDIQKDNFSDFVPSNNADDINLKYTD